MKMHGKIVCNLKKGIGMIRFEQDLGLYVARLVANERNIEFAVPRLGCHATFLNRKFDDFKPQDFKAFCKKKKGKTVCIEFDFKKVSCNLSKSGFYGVYATLDEKELDGLRKDVKVKTKKNARFWAHITFCTTKGIGIRRPKPFWHSITDDSIKK